MYCVNWSLMSRVCNLWQFRQYLFSVVFFLFIRSPDIHDGGLTGMFYHGFFLLLSFFRQLPAELAERNSTISGHLVGSKCDLKMHVWNVGYPFSLQIRGQSCLVSTQFPICNCSISNILRITENLEIGNWVERTRQSGIVRVSGGNKLLGNHTTPVYINVINSQHAQNTEAEALSWDTAHCWLL